MTPHTLLLVPPPGSDLLADEPGGGRVPTIRQCGCGKWGHSGCSYIPPLPEALLFVWEGKPVPMGIDRAARCLTARTVERVRREGTGIIRAFAPQSEYRIGRAKSMQPYGILDLCDAWEVEGARVVALDAMPAEEMAELIAKKHAEAAPVVPPWRWVRVGSGDCYDLVTPSGNIRAVIERDGTGWRPRIPGRGDLWRSPNLFAAVRTLRGPLGADVPEVP